MADDLRDVSTHFRFGENWADYSYLVDEDRIANACHSVADLVGDVSDKSFLDIGSGSGLFSVAAVKLGASKVFAIDIDAESVATTRSLLEKHGRGAWRAEQMSVFDLPARVPDRFDIVYSWGVLHHTGDMWRALDSAAEMVNPGGLLAVALYERTPMCGAWTLEKRVYHRLPARLQKLVQGAYLGAWGAGMLAKGRNPVRLVREGGQRGMSIVHDVHDWLGGYPYESTKLDDVVAFVTKRGFVHEKSVPWRVRLRGLLGSGCSEYVFRKASQPTAASKRGAVK